MFGYGDVMGKKSAIKKGEAKKKKRIRRCVALTGVCVLFLTMAAVMVVLLWDEGNPEDPISMQERNEKEMPAVKELPIVWEKVSDPETSEKPEIQPEETTRYGAQLADKEYCEANWIHEKEAASKEEIVLTFAGDVLLAEGYANLGALTGRGGSIRECFDEFILKEMLDADIFMLNNEFPYSDRGTPLEDKMYTFRSNPENVAYILEMGADIVSLANNHAYDYGETALLDTLDTLKGADLPYVGAGRDLEEAAKPVYFILNDYKIAYVSATQIEQFDNPDTRGAAENLPGVFRCWNDDYVCEVIREAKENADFVVAYVHWGSEMKDTLQWAQTDQARKMTEAGADLIVGAHPHCLQGIEYINDTPVVYSLGNFWFNSKTQDTGILKAVIDKNGLKTLEFIPAIQSNCKTGIASESDTQRILEYLQSLSPTVKIDRFGKITKNA